MATTTQQIKKVGGSLMVVIPKEMVALEDLHQDEFIEVTVRKVRRSYFGAFKDLKQFNKKEDRTRFRYE